MNKNKQTGFFSSSVSIVNISVRQDHLIYNLSSDICICEIKFSVMLVLGKHLFIEKRRKKLKEHFIQPFSSSHITDWDVVLSLKFPTKF